MTFAIIVIATLSLSACYSNNNSIDAVKRTMPADDEYEESTFQKAVKSLNGNEYEKYFDEFSQIKESIITEEGEQLMLFLVERVENAGELFWAVYLQEDDSRFNSTPSATPIIHSYEKKIEKQYSDYYSIPITYPYEEYNNQYQAWFTGTLNLQSTSKSGNFWYGSYKGLIFGNI